MRRVICCTTVATLGLSSLAIAGAPPQLDVGTATKVAKHVRHLELRNHFHLRKRLGGPFDLSLAGCEMTTPAHRQRVRCSYEAVQRNTDAQGKRTSCTINVWVRLHWKGAVAQRKTWTTWKRKIAVCATSYRDPMAPLPPGVS